MKFYELIRTENVLLFLVSRGLYSLAASGVPALLTLVVAGSGFGVQGIGVVLGIGAIPGLVGSVVSPSLLRRATPRAVFAAASVMWIAICFVLGILSLRGDLDLWLYVVVSFALEFIASLMYPTMGSYVADLVPPTLLERVNSLRAVVSSTCSVLGPVLIVLVLAWGGAPTAWLGLSGILLVSLAAQVRLPPGLRTQVESNKVLWSRGIRQIRGNVPVLAVFISSGIWHLTIWSVYATVGPIVLRDDYSLLWAWGLFESLFAIGGILGSMLPVPKKFSPAISCLIALLCFIPVPVSLVFGVPIWIVGALVFISSAALANATIGWVTFLQTSFNRDDLPTIFALDYLVGDGFAPFGYLLIPVILELTGLNAGIYGLTGICLLVLAVSVITTVRHRSMNAEPKEIRD